jgi:hypothetical protein
MMSVPLTRAEAEKLLANLQTVLCQQPSMSETKMSDYIKGFNAGVDCVLTKLSASRK